MPKARMTTATTPIVSQRFQSIAFSSAVDTPRFFPQSSRGAAWQSRHSTDLDAHLPKRFHTRAGTQRYRAPPTEKPLHVAIITLVTVKGGKAPYTRKHAADRDL